MSLMNRARRPPASASPAQKPGHGRRESEGEKQVRLSRPPLPRSRCSLSSPSPGLWGRPKGAARLGRWMPGRGFRGDGGEDGDPWGRKEGGAARCKQNREAVPSAPRAGLASRHGGTRAGGLEIPPGLLAPTFAGPSRRRSGGPPAGERGIPAPPEGTTFPPLKIVRWTEPSGRSFPTR